MTRTNRLKVSFTGFILATILHKPMLSAKKNQRNAFQIEKNLLDNNKQKTLRQLTPMYKKKTQNHFRAAVYISVRYNTRHRKFFIRQHNLHPSVNYK